VNDLTQYRTALPHIRPGDIVVFRGTAAISWAIRILGGSDLTHAAMVRQARHSISGAPDVLITESTFDSTANGVHTVPLGPTLACYGDGAQAALLRLRPGIRTSIDWQRFYAFIGACDEIVRYDKAGLVGFLLRELPILGPRICQSTDPCKMFCNAYVIAILEACGVLHGIDERKTTPDYVARMNLYEPNPIPLIGKPMRIKLFNTI
jgi:hypothetical protein